jgi:hypothetical protein
MALRPRKKIDI